MEYVRDPRDLRNLACCNKMLYNTLTLDMAYKCVAARNKTRGRKSIQVHVSQELSDMQSRRPFERDTKCAKLFNPMHALNRSCKYWTNVEANGRNPVLGSEPYLSRHILQYVNDTRTLYNLSQVNKCLRRCIDVPMVVRCGLLQGGKPMAAIVQIYPALRNKSIYPPDGLRLLHICNGKRCEFCYNKSVNPNHCKGQLHCDQSYTNQRRTLPRADNGTYACWNCYSKHRNPHIAKSWKYPSLTRKYHKVVYSRTKKQYYLKGAYLRNREHLFELFNHSRSIAKPYFKRWHRPIIIDDGQGFGRVEYIPTTRRSVVHEVRADGQEFFWNGNRVTNDGVEYVWAAPTKDASGLPIGPLLNYTLINDAVAYLKDIDNDGLDHFYDRVIPNPPNATLYDDFLNAYEGNIGPAKELQERRKTARLASTAHRQYQKVEWTVRAIARVAKHVTLKRLRRANRKAARYRSIFQPTHKDVMAVRRLLLLYKEDHRKYPKRMIQYITGNDQMNELLLDVLYDKVLMRPFDFVCTKGAASEAANAICQAVIEEGFLHCMFRYTRVYEKTHIYGQYGVQRSFRAYRSIPLRDGTAEFPHGRYRQRRQNERVV